MLPLHAYACFCVFVRGYLSQRTNAIECRAGCVASIAGVDGSLKFGSLRSDSLGIFLGCISGFLVAAAGGFALTASPFKVFAF
jgi:hypothetical protein